MKADLAKRIVADFYSEADARKAEEEFNAMFRNKQAPEAVEERDAVVRCVEVAEVVGRTRAGSIDGGSAPA